MAKIAIPVHLSDRGELCEVIAMRGIVNANDVSLGGETYPPESLVFLGFSGNKNGDGTFDGRYEFREADNQDEENRRARFSAIPNLHERAIAIA